MNVVMTESGRFVEVQGTAEGAAFTGPSSTAAGPGRAGHRPDHRAAARLLAEPPEPPPPSAVGAPVVPPQPRQGGRDRRHPRAGVRPGAAPADVPDVVEDGQTSRRTPDSRRSRLPATGLPAVADDTGLEVDALGGDPGVARRATPARGAATSTTWTTPRRAERVGARARRGRRARFRTVALVRFPDGASSWPRAGRGAIARRRRATGDFGYDPVFVPDLPDGHPDGRTFAELSAAGEARGVPPGPGVPGAGRPVGLSRSPDWARRIPFRY